MGFEELNKKRKNWVAANAENGFDEGINNLLTELYPDNAHFIYELLQNAEDTEATRVEFTLHAERLEFTHNGKRLFNDKDIESITSIGNSTKKDDINQIGKFGVGFKAVFSYTDTPRIYSGDVAFEIQNLVVPEAIENINTDSNRTLMVFPFNNLKKNKKRAFEEIKDGLAALHDNTLLFLHNIEEIHYSIGAATNQIKRSEENETITIENLKNNTTTKWLRYKKYLSGDSGLYVAIAYRLDELDNKKAEIIPVNGEVSIFFPAEKETSKLKFHIHAPFASTVARDSIKNLPENEKLIALIGDTVVESLEDIKNKNLLNFSFLEVLPNSGDFLAPFYNTIWEKTVEAFKTRPLILTDNNEYRYAEQCYRGSTKVKSILTEQMITFFEDRDRYWLKNPPLKNSSRSDLFIKDLAIVDISEEELCKILGSFCNHENFERYAKATELLNMQSDMWYQKLYAQLYDWKDQYEDYYEDYIYLVRFNDGKRNEEGKPCFFYSENIPSEQYKILKYETYASGKNQKEQQKAKSFLESMGVKEIGKKQEIESLLQAYYKRGKHPNDETHLIHMRQILNYYDTLSQSEIPAEIEFMKEYFIARFQEWNQYKWVRPQDASIDEPYEKTGLSALKAIQGIDTFLLHPCYTKLPKKEQKLLLEMLKKLGAGTTLNVVPEPIYKHPTFRLPGHERPETCIKENWTIENLEEMLKKRSFAISLLVWNTVIKLDKKYQSARYRPNKKNDPQSGYSSLVYSLRKYLWIPDRNGNFHKPMDISRELLPEEFVIDDRNGWLSAIQLGENIKKNQKEYQEHDKFLKDTTGLDLETIKDLEGIPKEELKKFSQEFKSKSLKKEPEEQSPKLQHAIKKHEKEIDSVKTQPVDPPIVKDQIVYLKALPKQHNHTTHKSKLAQHRRYNANIKHGREETKTFFYGQYQGHCQICGFTFSKRVGENYSELFDWFSAKIAKISTDDISTGSALNLCPNCHAMLKNGDFHAVFLEKLNHFDAVNKTFDQFAEDLNTDVPSEEVPECYEVVEMDMYKIPIRLNNQNRVIYFTEEHFLHFFDILCLK